MPKSSRQITFRNTQLVLTCEHADNRIPREYAGLFRGAASVVNSHLGWDPGALELAQFLGRHFHLPVLYVNWCRLLVESNRAPTNPRIWSKYTARLSVADKHNILERYWWPHRREVEIHIKHRLEQKNKVVHVAVHSFVPVLGGTHRNADIGLLYDYRRTRERDFCRRWQSALANLAPDVRVRRNYPYPGYTDGLCAWLRRRHRTDRYIGVELEINQALGKGTGKKSIHQLIANSLEQCMQNLQSPVNMSASHTPSLLSREY